VSGQVKSHTSVLLQDHGIREAWSGRLPSDRRRPESSSTAGTPALQSARAMGSFTM